LCDDFISGGFLITRLAAFDSRCENRHTMRVIRLPTAGAFFSFLLTAKKLTAQEHKRKLNPDKRRAFSLNKQTHIFLTFVMENES